MPGPKGPAEWPEDLGCDQCTRTSSTRAPTPLELFLPPLREHLPAHGSHAPACAECGRAPAAQARPSPPPGGCQRV